MTPTPAAIRAYWAEWWATDHDIDAPVPDIERAIARREAMYADAASASDRDCDETDALPDPEEEVCGENFDHDTETTFEDETGWQWECIRCGAEGWADADGSEA